MIAPERADTLSGLSMSSPPRTPARRDHARALRCIGAAAIVALSLAGAARAQEAEESLLDLPHRARAILPAGLVQLESMYVGHPALHAPSGLDPSGSELHHLLSRLEVRVPIEHLLLTASFVEGWMFLADGEEAMLLHLLGSPQVGASYRDAIGSWRYELGGATTIPIGGYDLVRHREPTVMPVFPRLPLRNLFASAPQAWGAWHEAQVTHETWSIQVRARVEVDALPEIVLAGEVVSELLALEWRTAIEGAYRFDELGLIGLRAQLVVDFHQHLELVTLEPMLRVGGLESGAGLIASVAVPIVFWPRVAGFYEGGLWSVGVRASAGAVF